MSDINITINVEGESSENKVSVKKTPSRQNMKPPFKIARRQTKLGRSSVLQLPPMVESDATQRKGLLDLLGV